MALEKVRIDRWLWAVRAYKTRSLATDACKRNWVSVNGTKIKPSREIRAKDIITFKKGPLERIVRVLKVLEKRISPKLVEEFLEDLTPKTNYEEAENKKRTIISSPFGMRSSKGRPSKKERRELEDFYYQTDEN